MKEAIFRYSLFHFESTKNTSAGAIRFPHIFWMVTVIPFH